MAGRQHTCLIVESDHVLREKLKECATVHGFQAVYCDGLFTCETCQYEPDAVIFGEGANIASIDDHIGNIELLVRECQAPVVGPETLRDQLMEHFDDIYVYPDLDHIAEMIFPLVFNQARRMSIRNDMVLAMQGIQYMDQAEFSFKKLEEAQALALLLASFAPEKRILRLGLTELFVNAVEHGNLKISKEEKENLRQKGKWLDEVEERLKQDQFKDKSVTTRVQKESDQVKIRIEDEGDGFDWKEVFENVDQANKLKKKSGRGLFIVKKTGLDTIEYKGRGNIVECSFSIPTKEQPIV